jgi:hypothetical protein
MLTLLLAGFAAAFAAPADDALRAYQEGLARGGRPTQGRVIVFGAPSAAQIAQRACTVHRRLPSRPVVVLSCEGPLGAQIAAWAAQPGVTWAEADWQAELLSLPDDYSASAWHLLNSGQTIGGAAGVAGADLGAEAAWLRGTGDGAVILAVLDTGQRLDHADLLDNLYQNPGELDCADGLDDDANGYIDDCFGADAADGDGDPSATASSCSYPSHGTFIAGLVGASTDNGQGMAGINWATAILPIKIQSDADCGVSASGIAAAVDYAREAGATALNASWHVSATALVVKRAFQDADDAGLITVIAAGNDALDLDTTSPDWPIAYDLPQAIVVGASTHRDGLAWFSNHSATWVDLVAPGQDLTSAEIGSTTAYAVQSGTSFAAPMALGAVGLVASTYPRLHPDEVWDSVVEGVVAVPALDCAASSTCVRTGGRLHLPAALDRAEAWMERITLSLSAVEMAGEADGDGVAEGHEAITLRVWVQNDGHARAPGVTATLHAEGATALGASVAADIDPEGGVAAIEGLGLQLDAPCAADLELPLTLTLTEAGGGTWTASATVPITCRQDEDADGAWSDEDCDEAAADTYPGAEETCDDRDQDCDGEVDEGATDAPTWFRDVDGDGVGDADHNQTSCLGPEGFVSGAGDCADDDVDIGPGVAELCDGIDQNCDGAIDEGLDCVTAEAPRRAEKGGGCAVLGPQAGLGGALTLLLALARRRR